MSEHSTLQREFPVRAIGACFAIAAFGVAITAGLGAGREAEEVLTTAIIAMFVCQPVGMALGFAFKCASVEQLETYKESNPIPAPHESRAADEPNESQADAQESTDSRTDSG